jgi:hypothetical protein
MEGVRQHHGGMKVNQLPRGLDRSSTIFFNVLIAYEDFATGNRALSVFDRLFPASGGSPFFSTHNVWKFDLLEITKFRDVAAAEAANADMVIISAHVGRELPAVVKRWMEIWIKRRHAESGALVVLLDGQKSRVTPDLRMETYLQTCAVRAGMDFFIQREKTRGTLHKPSDEDTSQAGRALPQTTLDKVITGIQWGTQRN